MRRFIAVFVAIVFGAQLATACAIPDDKSWEDLVRGVGALPPIQLTAARRFVANRNAHDYLRQLPPTGNPGWIVCRGTEVYDFDTESLADCLDVGTSRPVPWTLRDCINQAVATFEEERLATGGGGQNCRAEFRPWFQDLLNRHDDWDPEGIENEDVVRSLLIATAPPAWYLAALAAAGTLGGIPVAIPRALCAQGGDGTHWSCPGSPLHPGTPRPEGDR